MQSIHDTKDYLDLVFDDIEHFKTNTLPLLIAINVGLVMRWKVEGVVLFFCSHFYFHQGKYTSFKLPKAVLNFCFLGKKHRGCNL